jgi:undecaprenyl diphosphate synthase|tara:strand:- start:103053 stop:103802 length:750 start_codon:yes stop_codon:yes gene_type:complete
MSSTEPNSLNHVAIIMDGNSRWASDRGLPTLSGHEAGANRLRDVIAACEAESISVLTVFAFSSENWNRSKQEVRGLMTLFASSLRHYRKELVKRGVRLKVIGRRDRFSARLNKLIMQVEDQTSKGSRTLVVAADYGGQWDIAQAARSLAEDVAAGNIIPADITEESFQKAVCLSEFPPLDLLIRTGAETRVSNFLLWQLSYAELFFSQCYWPDFDCHWFQKAIREYHRRQRRFGANALADQAQNNKKVS